MRPCPGWAWVRYGLAILWASVTLSTGAAYMTNWFPSSMCGPWPRAAHLMPAGVVTWTYIGLLNDTNTAITTEHRTQTERDI